MAFARHHLHPVDLPHLQLDRQYFTGEHGLLRLASNLLLLQSWVPIKVWALSFDDVAWSLSVEAFFYLSFPVLIFWWARYWQAILAVLGAVAVAIIAVSNSLQLSAGNDYAGVGLLGIVYFNPVVRVLEFAVGIAACSVVRCCGSVTSGGLTTSQWFLIEIGALSAIVVGLLAATEPVGVSHVFGEAGGYYFQREGIWLLWALLIGVFALSKGPASMVPSTKPLVFLGEISFALYLVHAILVAYLEPYIGSAWIAGSLNCALFWIACLIMSALLYLGVERPLRRLIVHAYATRDFRIDTLRKSFEPIGAASLVSMVAFSTL